jgi:hypothetical protein
MKAASSAVADQHQQHLPGCQRACERLNEKWWSLLLLLNSLTL